MRPGALVVLDLTGLAVATTEAAESRQVSVQAFDVTRSIAVQSSSWRTSPDGSSVSCGGHRSATATSNSQRML
jgi:hypothetical protein